MHCSLRHMQSHVQANKFMCAIYCMHEMTVFSLFALLLLYISSKEKFFIEEFSIEYYIQEIKIIINGKINCNYLSLLDTDIIHRYILANTSSPDFAKYHLG